VRLEGRFFETPLRSVFRLLVSFQITALMPLASRHIDSRAYVAYQETVTLRHTLPLLRRLGIPLDCPILDMGCGTGGCAISLAAALDREVDGLDISAERIQCARQTAAELGVKAKFAVADGGSVESPQSTYGLILLRDVVEHVAGLKQFMTRLRTMIRDDGFLYVTFPPWRGPYAGHQHNAKSAARFMPYLHAIAPGTFLGLLHKWESGREEWLADERQIFANRLTRRSFEATISSCGWRIG
jgi:2-polyprenyl-3-methyl-5-hydroxy-6-metoxy-1,4-benzoquinol methylase